MDKEIEEINNTVFKNTVKAFSTEEINVFVMYEYVNVKIGDVFASYIIIYLTSNTVELHECV